MPEELSLVFDIGIMPFTEIEFGHEPVNGPCEER